MLCYVDPEVHREIGHLSVDTGRPVQSLMEEAIALLLKKHRRRERA